MGKKPDDRVDAEAKLEKSQRGQTVIARATGPKSSAQAAGERAILEDVDGGTIAQAAGIQAEIRRRISSSPEWKTALGEFQALLEDSLFQFLKMQADQRDRQQPFISDAHAKMLEDMWLKHASRSLTDGKDKFLAPLAKLLPDLVVAAVKHALK